MKVVLFIAKSSKNKIFNSTNANSIAKLFNDSTYADTIAKFCSQARKKKPNVDERRQQRSRLGGRNATFAVRCALPTSTELALETRVGSFSLF